MAFIIINKQFSNARSYRGTSIGLWTWLVIFLSVSNSQCLSDTGKCLGYEDTVFTEPQGSIDIEYGKPLEILCSAWNYTAKYLQFTLGEKVLPSSKVNGTTIKLYIKKPEVNRYFFYCTNQKTDTKCINYVLVETKPKKVINFTCLSSNIESLNCTWKSPHSFANVSYQIYFTVNGQVQKSIPGQRVPRSGTNSTWFSYWNISTLPPYRRQLSEYNFTLVAENVFGNSTEYFTFDHKSIMKLKKPSNLFVIYNTPHSVELQWELDNSITHLLNSDLKYRVVYTMPELSEGPPHDVNTTYLTSNKVDRNTFTLKNLPYAHTKYEVRMAIKPLLCKNDGYWSEDAVFNFQTPSKLPDIPPLIPAGAFIPSIYKNNMNNQEERIIDVFWKQLDRTQQNGANFTYKVLYTDKNHTLTLNSKGLNFIKLVGVSTEPLAVVLQSSNEMGSSVNTSHLYIPSVQEMLDPPTSFTKVAYANGTYELSWNINPTYINDIDNYTLFWCKYNISQSCSNGMNFSVLLPESKHQMIDLPKGASYQFALSVNRKHQTSGMVWARCDVAEDGISTYDFPVYLEIEAKGTTYIVLRWNLQCKFRDGIMKGFNVTYCALEKKATDCSSSFRKHVYTNDSTAESMNITNLLPFQKYSFNFYPHFAIGLKDIQVKINATTAEDVPSEPTNVTVSDVEFNQLNLTWYPPHYKNGIIRNYIIYQNGHRIDYKSASENDSGPISLSVTGLTGFTNYTFDIKACNSYDSKNNGTVIVRTKIGPPNKLSKPKINGNVVSWTTPASRDVIGTYQVSRIIDDNQPIISNFSDLETQFDICDRAGSYEKFQVRAVNVDDDPSHGVVVFKGNILPSNNTITNHQEYIGEWSEPQIVPCHRSNIMMWVYITVAMTVISLSMYLSVKRYKKGRFQNNIIPKLPPGLDPQKDIPEYTSGSWTPDTKDEKSAPSDEDLLLPNNKLLTSTPDTTQKEENCGASDRTESTEFSNSSQGPYDREPSDNCSNNSLPISGKGDSMDERPELQDNENSLSSSTEKSDNSPFFGDLKLKNSGYVLSVAQPVTPPSKSEYIQAPPTTNTMLHPTTSSYVMASFAPPVLSSINRRPGYYDNGAMIHDKHNKPFMNFPKLGPSPTKSPGPENLPNIPSLPPASKDSSYIQLQSLDVLPSQKLGVEEPVTKPPATSGYISPQDMVLHKHLNILSRSQLREEPNSLDPAMTPDAYCRFSWNTDPSKDNINKILAESPSVDISKN